ncbi:class I SAM-dependent methyltransferase [Flavobacterium algicola]|uniref:class I SAM-dependent methyltransferase n=1 Tax=Flavobacterium algicola TaxID=556529 RepID=UPI001EFE6DE6|nr:methyltransferase domain-containing protein [Flavobacterium algicola]MCG9793910.1 class I SAM-dependent methyltransferase [Flavobacterium algicola]
MKDLDSYSNQFYQNQLLESVSSAEVVVPLINKLCSPKSIIDVGCGVGAWLDVWKRCVNVTKVTGIDADFIDKSLLILDLDTEFEEVDLSKKLPSYKKYDLAICLEVAEHLEEKRASSFVQDLTNLSDIVLFSAAIPGQEGTQHINEQFLKYWITEFSKNDYNCLDVVRPMIWDNDSVSWWFRQNMVLFVRNGTVLKDDIYKMQTFNCFDLVHKELLIHKTNKENNFIKDTVTSGNYVAALVKKILRKFK